MRVFLGMLLFLSSLLLAIYNIKRNDRKEITGPTLSLIFASFVGLALLLNLKFELLGFNSSQFDEKIKEAQRAKDEAVEAKNLAERALKETKVIYAINLLRTGMLPSELTLQEDRQRAIRLLKDAYGEQYDIKTKELKDNRLVPSGVDF